MSQIILICIFCNIQWLMNIILNIHLLKNKHKQKKYIKLKIQPIKIYLSLLKYNHNIKKNNPVYLP